MTKPLQPDPRRRPLDFGPCDPPPQDLLLAGFVNGVTLMFVAWFTGENADRHLFSLAVVVYGLSVIYSVFLWRKGFRQDNRVNYLLLLVAFGLHTTAMVKRGFSLNYCPVT